MPSDRPPPEPPSPGSDPAGRRRPTSTVRDGTLVFALVLGGFVAYALGAPATYRATALVAVEPTSGSTGLALPKPKDATALMRGAALEPALVTTLAAEGRVAPNETATQAGSRISNALSVESSDGRRFTFAATAPTPERSQRVVNEFAQQAAKRAAQVLDPQPPVADSGARAKAELFDFLETHPGIASEPSAAPARKGPDALVLSLRAERARIEEKLAHPPVPTADNPYEEPGPLDKPEFLKRRLKEIDSALEARAKLEPSRKSPTPAASASAGSNAADRAEWQRLLRAASERPESPPAAASRLRVTLARAALPRLPIEPDRPRLVLLGVLVASIAGVLAGLLRGLFEARAVRRYGMTTGKHPITHTIGLPQTTLRIPRAELLKPKSEPPPTPVPTEPPKLAPSTPIPPAPRVPAPITPIPPAPPAPVTLVGAIAPSTITPVPPAPVAPSTITPIPPAPIAPSTITPVPPAPAAASPITPMPPAALGPALITTIPPARAARDKARVPPETPIPPALVAPPGNNSFPLEPMVIQSPTAASDPDAPPTTQGYGEAERPVRPGRNAGRRITKIYGTPPPPDLEEETKALRKTQAYGSPPVAIPPQLPAEIPQSITPFPAEVLPPPYRSSLRPAPMIPLSRSSTAPPPAAAPPTRSSVPLVETSYSYVQTPVPEAHSIPQTPIPRRPSPPPRTEPYGSLPPAQRRPSPPPMKTPVPPSPKLTPKTPTPPAPEVAAPSVVVRTHPVDSSWRPSTTLAPARKRALAGEILTLAVERCIVVGVTGVRGAADKKSIAAAEIALALSEAKHPRVLLMESDFHFPQVQKWLSLDIPFVAGFSQQLRGRIEGGREGRWHVVECKPSLHVLAEGVMRSPGLLLSNQFEQAMKELRGYYDIIVIDAPIAPSESDGRAIADVVDGAVVVGSANRANEVMEVSKIFSGKKLLRSIES